MSKVVFTYLVFSNAAEIKKENTKVFDNFRLTLYSALI